jgi:hypothetical protein
VASGSIEQMADRVAALMEQRMRIGGASLSEKLRRGGRALPRGVRAEADFLAEACRQAANPKLLPQIDRGRVAQAHDACMRHLQGLDRAARRRATLMGIASSIAFSLFAVALLVLAILRWRGLV